MELQKRRLGSDDFPVQLGEFLGSMLIFRRVSPVYNFALSMLHAQKLMPGFRGPTPECVALSAYEGDLLSDMERNLHVNIGDNKY